MITRLRIPAFLTLALFAAASAFAATQTVGGLNSAVVFSASQNTYIDLARPATGDGDYATGTIYWTGASSNCAGLFMVKFYRPDGSGENLQFVAERGPYSVNNGLVDLDLSPPVTLKQGDVVGVTELNPDGSCGALAMTAGGGNATLEFSGDTGTSDTSICNGNNPVLIPQTMGIIVRSSTTDSRAGIVLGVGSVQGAAGSNFKTSMQLYNPGAYSIRGYLFFHPIGAAGASTDPNLFYTLTPGQIIDYPDIVASIGGNGLGSIDVIAEGSWAPLVVTRIFNDGGAAGTAGFSEPMIRPGTENILGANESTFLLGPGDTTKFRMNIAVRSLSDGATVNFTVSGPDGAVLGGATKTYSGDTFDLEAASQLFPGVTLVPDSVIRATLSAGRAIVGGVTVDNTTNDTALQLGNRLRF